VSEGEVFDECALSAESKDDVTNASFEESVCGLLGGGKIDDWNSGESGGLSLVRGQVVAKRVDGGWQGGGGGWIEDGWNAVGAGELKAVLDGGEREFELGDEDAGGGDEGDGLIDLGWRELEAGARDNNDGVFTFSDVDKDGGGPVGSGLEKTYCVSIPSWR